MTGILDNRDDQLARLDSTRFDPTRLDSIVAGIMPTHAQLVAAVGVLTTTLREYFLDEERERGLGITE